MRYIFLLTGVLMNIFIADAQPAENIFEKEGVKITLIDEMPVDMTNTQVISFHGPTSRYYLEEYDKFLMTFSELDAGVEGVERMEVMVSGTTFELPGLQPFIIEGLEHGENVINISLYDSAGEKIVFPSGETGKLSFRLIDKKPLITNDAIVLGLLMVILALVFWTSHSDIPAFKKFYKYIPALLLCYFIPAIMSTLNIVSDATSNLYFVASRFFLPASLILLTISIDLKGIMRLGPKAVIMFLTGTVGIIIGGPIAILVISTFAPEAVGGQGPDAIWRGMATIAGSWIGGGANQTAMFEIFGASNRLFTIMAVVDVVVANIWMGVLLYGAGISEKIDKMFNADASAIEDVKHRIQEFQERVAKIPTLTNLFVVMGVAFGITGLSHLLSDWITPVIAANAPWANNLGLTSTFFWLIFFATSFGLILSFTNARNIEGYGASKIGSLFLYFLVATIGMKMDLKAIFDVPLLFLAGIIWMIIHVTLLLTVAKIIKAPFFFTAVGSQANVGGAASAPIVASAFHPSLATVGVLLAVFGYALGTYGAWLCAILMQGVAPN